MKVAILGPTVIGQTTLDNKTHRHVGGLPCYVGNVMAGLGCDVTAITTFSKGDEKFIKKSLPGIKLHLIPASRTIMFAQKYSSKDPDKRVMTVDNSENTLNYEQAGKLDDFDVLVYGPMFADNISDELYIKPKAVKVYGGFGLFQKEHGGKLIWAKPERALKLLKEMDFVFLDETEAVFLTNQKSAGAAGQYLVRLGIPNVIITMGSKGSIYFTKKGAKHFPAYPPKRITDPTGCGETYLGAFMYAFKQFPASSQWGVFAAMAGTMKIEVKGPLCTSKDRILRRLRTI